MAKKESILKRTGKKLDEWTDNPLLGLLNPAGYVSVGGKATQAGEIRFLEDTDDGANYIALKGPTGYGSNVTYILPTVDGADGDVLTTNALGTMSWTTPASGISAGFVIAMSIAL